MTFLSHSGPITAAEAKKQRRKLVASMAGDLRKKDRRILKGLRAALKEKRAERKRRLGEIRELCKTGKVEARARAKQRAADLKAHQKAERDAARAQTRAERAAACDTCDTKTAVKAETTAAVLSAAELLAAERARVKEEHASSYHKPATRTRAEAARERAESKAQSDDEVRNDIPAELVPVWEKVKHDPAMVATPRASRTEVFLQWVHDNSADVMHLIDVALHEDLAKLEREEKAHAHAIQKKDRYTRSPAHLAVDLDVNADEYRKGWESAQKEIDRASWTEQKARQYLADAEPATSDYARGFDDAVRRVAGVQAINTTRVLGKSEGPFQTPDEHQIKSQLRHVASADRLFVVAIRILGDWKSYATVIVDAADASEAERAALDAVAERHTNAQLEIASVWSPEVTNPDDWPARPVDPRLDDEAKAHAAEEAAEKAKPRPRSLFSIATDDDATLAERLAHPESAIERTRVAAEIDRRARASAAGAHVEAPAGVEKIGPNPGDWVVMIGRRFLGKAGRYTTSQRKAVVFEDRDTASAYASTTKNAKAIEIRGGAVIETNAPHGEAYELAIAELENEAHGPKVLRAARELVFAIRDGLPSGPTRANLERRFVEALREAKPSSSGAARIVDKITNHTPGDAAIKRYLREVPAHRLWVIGIENLSMGGGNAPRLITVIVEAGDALQAERAALDHIEHVYHLKQYSLRVGSLWSPEVVEPEGWPGRPRDLAGERQEWERGRDEADREIKRRGIVEVDEDEAVLRREARRAPVSAVRPVAHDVPTRRAKRDEDLSADEILELAHVEMRDPGRRHGEQTHHAAQHLAFAVHDGLPPGPTRTVLEQRFLTALRTYQREHPARSREIEAVPF